ncbi:MAG: tetratricopeptide repeat protein, partial [Candidatus Thiosymbion ectosymbiont of Robbea hypermnestra]|nr:tetratricopeptide repeat protein [Candidatus Thiosymbion ectosymbiont of Robbea hypermnestra]
MSLDLDRIFAGSHVPEWLRAFAADPDEALHDLLLGRAELGHLTVAEPVDLLLGWLHALGEPSGFADHLDRALAKWIETSWGRTELPDGGGSATLTTSAWFRVTGLLAATPVLKVAGRTLAEWVRADHRYLDSLAEGRSCDPQANAWLALATYQQDRSLLPLWWQLCELPPDQPWYRGHCGIAGLQALPPESAARAGGFPKELAEGLNRFGLALWRLQDEGWLDTRTATEEFQDSLRLKLATYPFPDRWLSFWRHALHRDHRRGDIGAWVRDLLPRAAAKPPSKHPQRQTWASYDPGWVERSGAIAERLRNNAEGAVEEAEQLLNEQHGYFDRSGDGNNLVRSATRFSAAIRKSRPALALAWARLAKDIEPWDGYAWTNEGAALTAQGDFEGAVAVYRETKARFPDNAHARTGLAETLKARHKLPEAEAEYRETKARFPDNAHARTGLAETLKARHKLPEAGAEYRETKARVPGGARARTGLAE